MLGLKAKFDVGDTPDIRKDIQKEQELLKQTESKQNLAFMALGLWAGLISLATIALLVVVYKKFNRDPWPSVATSASIKSDAESAIGDFDAIHHDKNSVIDFSNLRADVDNWARGGKTNGGFVSSSLSSSFVDVSLDDSVSTQGDDSPQSDVPEVHR